MATLPARKNLPTTFRQFREKIDTRTKINHWGSDSTIRTFVNTTASELLRQRMETQRAFKAIQISSASKRNLDRIAANWGLFRFSRKFASVDIREKSLAFYTNSTFGAINGGADIIIPAGTTITGPSSRGRSSPLQYRTDVAYTLSAGASIGYCGATALRAGPKQNVAAGTLRVHRFTGYTDSANDTLKVSNVFPILNGRSKERDTDLRFRVANRYTTLSKLNTTKIRLASLEVPGVLDISILSSYFGIGTCAVVVFGAKGASNADLTTKVQSKLLGIQVPGLKLVALTAVNVEFDFEITLNLLESITARSQASLEQGVKKSIQKYFLDNARSSCNLRAIRESIYRAAGSAITQVDSASSDPTSFFDAVYVRRKYANEISTSEREEMIKPSYVVQPDESAQAGIITVRFRVKS